jgi:aldehyde dehydrogenase (NAD+)
MNTYQDLFEAQKGLFATNVTRTYAWRIEQLDRMGRMIREDEVALQNAIARDFKTARALSGQVGSYPAALK